MGIPNFGTACTFQLGGRERSGGVVWCGVCRVSVYAEIKGNLLPVVMDPFVMLCI